MLMELAKVNIVKLKIKFVLNKIKNNQAIYFIA